MSNCPICIVGMHRSNTSMLAQMLHVCGFYIGPPDMLVPADDPARADIERRYGITDNPDGYWEDRRFLELNDEILVAFGGEVNDPPVFPANWLHDPRLKTIRPKCEALIATQPRNEPWIWKDPRTSLTLPLWKDLLPGLRLIVCVREPRQVASSIVKRALAQITVTRALDLWEEYNSRILLELPGTDHLVTHADSLLFDPKAELERVVHFSGRDVDPSRFEAAVEVVKPGLRRSTSVGAFAEHLSPALLQSYERLCAQCGPVFERLMSEPQVSTVTVEEALGRLEEFQHLFALKTEASHIRDEEYRTELESLRKRNAELEQRLGELTRYERWLPLIRPLFRLYHVVKRTKT